ncbi:MAG: 2-hydroxychromene-2-carboxylate isomerase [Rhodospirillaceae bacterium]|nr:2-hydroxychromene-2-carboxylate isomerase [Rhodospirillaceae bacterium]
MPETLDFYFDFTSPYGYIASQVIDDLAARHGCATRWHAFMVTAAYKQHNASNPLAHTAKEAYFRRDIPRTAAHFGVPFAFPPSWPENLVAAGRAFVWIDGRDPAAAKRFATAALRAYWAEGKALADPETVADIGAAAGEDRAMLRAALDDAAVKQRFIAAGNEVLAKGVFGSPQVVFRGELFWGTDRLVQLEAALDAAGLKAS